MRLIHGKSDLWSIFDLSPREQNVGVEGVVTPCHGEAAIVALSGSCTSISCNFFCWSIPPGERQKILLSK